MNFLLNNIRQIKIKHLLRLFIIGSIFIGSSYKLYSQSQIDSTKNVKIISNNQNAINLSASLGLGKEIGIIGSFEYESREWGKVMLRQELSYIGTQKYLLYGAILDLGIGYGYPVLRKNTHTLFINGYVTWYYSGLFSWADGQSAIIELEYRKKGKQRCLVIAPFFRYAATNQFISTYRAFDYSFGIRIGLAWQNTLNLKNNK